LQKLADEIGLEISVSHFPPGTSKWNKIEHRWPNSISEETSFMAIGTTVSGLHYSLQTNQKTLEGSQHADRDEQFDYHRHWPGGEKQARHQQVSCGVEGVRPTATVAFAGLVAPGEFQFNVVVPSSLANGDQPVTATYNGLTTQAGTLLTVHQ
jgi:hypothetical protein